MTDTLPKTLRTAKQIRACTKNCSVFYFGPRLDDAKLLNVENIKKFVVFGSCRLQNTPWLSPNFQRTSQAGIQVISLYEYEC